MSILDIEVRFSTQFIVVDVLSMTLKLFPYMKSVRHAVAQLAKALCNNRKAAGSNSDGVIVIFHWNDPSGRTVALKSTQTLTEISNRNISWG
jgi:hypothetical protein